MSQPVFAPEATSRYRKAYQRRILPAGYCGLCHLALVVGAGGAGIALALWLASERWRPADLYVVPATVLIANTVEYLAHRGPMHHRRRGLIALHTRHTTRHHRYFTQDAMHFGLVQDFHAVLFPPALLLFFGAVIMTLGSLATVFLPSSATALFVATALSYYLLYELLHFLYHVPPQWRVGRLPAVRWLAALHRLHHDPRHMQAHNFNLVFPLWDWIAGTLHTGALTKDDADDPQAC